jgi:hypothetical protein
MSDSIFQDAYARVRSRHTNQGWFALAPREITEMIYREIRLIDAERAGTSVSIPAEEMVIAAE